MTVMTTRDPPANQRASISTVVPVLNEQDNVIPMYSALAEMAATRPDCDFEFLFVDDGSTDKTYERVSQLNASDSRVKVVKLSRNFGSHIAAAAGLQLCSGDGAVIMAGDLQDHPRELPRFIEKWLEGYHVIWGVRASRQDSAVDTFLARAFSWIIRRIALPNFPAGGTGTFCLIDRRVINALNSFPERNRMTFGLILYSGFRQTSLFYDRLERHSGKSKWSFRSKVRIATDTVVSFSSAPIRLISTAGYAMAEILYFAASRILAGAGYLKTFSPNQLNTLALLSLKVSGFGGGMFLLFYGVASVLLGTLIYRSSFLPRGLGVLLAISGLGFVAKTFASVLAPAYASSLLLIPTVVAGLSLTLWLLVRGVDVSKWQEGAGLDECCGAFRGEISSPSHSPLLEGTK